MQDPPNSPRVNDLEPEDPIVRKFLDLVEKASRCSVRVEWGTLCRVAQALTMTPSFGKTFEPYDDHDLAVFHSWMGGDDRFRISGWGWTVRSCDHPDCIIRRTHNT